MYPRVDTAAIAGPGDRSRPPAARSVSGKTTDRPMPMIANPLIAPGGARGRVSPAVASNAPIRTVTDPPSRAAAPSPSRRPPPWSARRRPAPKERCPRSRRPPRRDRCRSNRTLRLASAPSARRDAFAAGATCPTNHASSLEVCVPRVPEVPKAGRSCLRGLPSRRTAHWDMTPDQLQHQCPPRAVE